MNKHGQTLVIFIVILPLILLFAALIIDVGLLVGEKIKVAGVTNDILMTYDKTNEFDLEEEITKYYQNNHIILNELKINKTENSFEIEVKCSMKSIFGNIIGMKEYPIHIKKNRGLA